MQRKQELIHAFAEQFGREKEHVVRAPGRVNLIGEHTDYNDGFVLPIAIERETLAAVAMREDDRLHLASRQSDENAVVDLAEPIEPSTPAWANYARGVAAGLRDAGIEVPAADVLFDSDVPVGAGLSSSAALEVATAMALLAAAGKTGAISGMDLAKLCQTAEHEFAGAPCGIMDQAIAVMGRAGHALLLDCRNGRTEQVPFDDPSTVLLVVDTQVKHEIAEGSYARRRRTCERAAKKLGVNSLRDVDGQMLARAERKRKLTPTEMQRAKHVVGEIHRTRVAADVLRERKLIRFGELMYASHDSLRGDYDVSCDELDAVVELASRCEGVYGARMTGGGFGGSDIVLVETEHLEDAAGKIADGFDLRFGRRPPIFATRAAAGAQADI